MKSDSRKRLSGLHGTQLSARPVRNVQSYPRTTTYAAPVGNRLRTEAERLSEGLKQSLERNTRVCPGCDTLMLIPEDDYICKGCRSQGC